MKRKNISLNYSLRSRAESVSPLIVSSIPGDIRGCNPKQGFSRSWTWKQNIPEPENWDGTPVSGTVFLGADDGATLKIGEICIKVPDNYGPQGGSPYTSKSVSVSLAPGIYEVSLSYFNINYNPPSLNVARLDFSLPGEAVGEIIPEENDDIPEESACECTDEDDGGVPAKPKARPVRSRMFVAEMSLPEKRSSSSAGRNTRLSVNGTSARWQTDFGKFRGLCEIPSGRLEILAYAFKPELATPAMLEWRHPLNTWLALPEGGVVSGSQVKIFSGGSYTSWYCGAAGHFFPVGTSSKTSARLAWNSDETELILTYPDKSAIAFSATDGELVAYTTKNGNTLTASEMASYVDVVRDKEGVLLQIWNLWDGLASIENLSESGYEIALYLPSSVGEKDSESGLYPVTGTPFKRFTLGVSALGKLTITESDSRSGAIPFTRSVWFENGAWNSSVGSGEEEIVTRRERTEIDDTHFRVATELSRVGESVPATSTEEIFEIHPVLGNLCVSRTEGYGTDYAETTHFGYDTSGRLVREERSDGGIVETSYDNFGRLSARYEPDAIGRKITYYVYRSETNNDADLSYSRVVLEKADGTPVQFSRTDYRYFGETDFRRIERRTSVLGSDNTQFEVEEIFLGTCENVHSRGRVKMTQNKLGVQTHYDYASTALYGALYTQTSETRISGDVVPGKSSRDVKFISSDGNMLRTEKYLLDAKGIWRLVASVDFEYDAQNRETKRIRGNGRVSSRESMCCGTLWEIDEDGVRTDYAYDTAQHLREKTRALTTTQPERTQIFTRDAAGRITREVLKLNSVDFSEKTATWDALGRVVSENDELGRTSTHTYALDAASCIRTETVMLPSGATRITKTHADGTVLSEGGTACRNIETVIESVSDGIRTTRRIAGVTGDSAILSREIRNGFGETIRTEIPNTLGEFIYTRNTFDTRGLLICAETDSLAPTLYEYDAFGTETKRTIALADMPTVLNSRITATETQFETREDGVYRLASTTTYSASGTALVTTLATLVSESAILESKTISTDVRGNATMRWTEFGEPGVRISRTQIPTAINIAQTITNDGFTVSQLDHAGTQTTFSRQYNTGANSGIMLTTTDGRGNTTLVEQNVLGWTIKTTDAAGNVTETAYDLAQGKPSCVTDALGQTRCYAYDLHGNVVAEFGTGVQPVVFVFDDADNPVSQKLFRVSGEIIEADPRFLEDLAADETTWLYDSATGLLLTKIYPDESQSDYEYDTQNRLVSIRWTREVSPGIRLKASRTYAEKTGELLSVAYNDGTVGEAHTYNHLGQITQTVDASGTRVFVYNTFNEVERETLTGDGTEHTVAELRDGLGRSIGYTYSKSGVLQQTTGATYAAATGQLATVGFVHGGTERTFRYNYLSGANLLESLSCPSNLTIVHAYEDKRDLVAGITIRRGAGTNVVLRNYTYDALGRPLTRSTLRNGATQRDVFGYNARSELVSAMLGDAEYSYGFDNVGNRTISSELSTETSYLTNNLNQYSEIVDKTLSGHFVPEYDADGNATLIETSTGTWQITYNGANRPVRFVNTETQTVVDCGYDSQGRRYFRKVTVAGVVTLHQCYLYRGYLQIAALDLMRSAHPALWFVVWDPLQPVAARPLALQKDGTWFTYGYDITKNVCEVFGPHGYIRTAYSYAPYGAVSASGDVAQPFRWSSEHYDTELGLVYYNYRHYSPSLGRFLSRDPIEEQGGRNLYAFVKNVPILKFDLLGQNFCSFIEEAEAKSFEMLKEQIKKIGKLAERFPDRLKNEFERIVVREFRKRWIEHGSGGPIEDFSFLTSFYKINSVEEKEAGFALSFSAYISSAPIVNINNRNYGLRGTVEYELSRDELDSKLKITNNTGICGLNVDLDYQINRNWSFEISFAYERSYVESASEKQKSSVSFNFTYRK